MRHGTLAYQGEPGAFSELAARHFGGPLAQLIPCQNFTALFSLVCNGQADWGVVPIENQLAGPVTECITLLRTRPIAVVDETAIDISLALIACRPVPLSHITRIYSHPMALLQCKKFLSEYPNMVPIPVHDTAGAARMIVEMKNPALAAVASSHCVHIYGGNIICTDVQRESSNLTRFVLIRRAP